MPENREHHHSPLNRKIQWEKFFPKLEGEGLNPISPMNQLVKIMEELGELSTLTGIFTGDHGERKQNDYSDRQALAEKVVAESMDVIQASMNLIYYFRDKEGIEIDPIFRDHLRKMKERRYLKE